jgi:hypothetical protein
MDARELMLKSIGGYPMATKASDTLVLIIEKQHAPWDLMVTALPALELHFRCQLRIASARPILGPSSPCARVVVHVYVELSYGLLLACIPSSGLLRLAWQQLDSCIVNLGACWPHTVPRRCSRRASSTAAGVCPVVSGVKMGPAAYANHTAPSPGCALQGLRPW